MTTLSAHGGGIFRVDLADRPAPWVARIVPPEARAAERLHEEVEILRLLERVDFPAERGAHPEPVTAYRGQHVLVTGYADGEPRPDTADRVRRLADALGKLHSTNLDGAAIRDGGGWGHDPAHVGKPHAVIDGYAQHVRPTSKELDRLVGAMRLLPAYYAAWGYWRAVASGRPPDGSERWWPDHHATDAIAARVAARLTDGGPER